MTTLEELNDDCPEHDRSSCSDENPFNAGVDFRYGTVWCRRCEGLRQLKTISERPLVDDREKLLEIIAAAYQIAGAYDAPTQVLDVLANPTSATQEQINALLPFVPLFGKLVENHGGKFASEVAEIVSYPAKRTVTAAEHNILIKSLIKSGKVVSRPAELNSTERQSWELHLVQAGNIRALLDLHAPETEGNLETRLEAVFDDLETVCR